MTLEQLFLMMHGPEENAFMPSVVIELENIGGFNVADFSIKEMSCLLVQCENGPVVEINKSNMDQFVVQADETISGVDCLGRKVKFFLNAAFVKDWAD